MISFNEIRTFTGTIGFSVSVDGTGGQTLFSNLTTDPGRSESEAREGETAEAPEASLGLEGSHILTRLEIDPVLFLLFSSSSDGTVARGSSVCVEVVRQPRGLARTTSREE